MLIETGMMVVCCHPCSEREAELGAGAQVDENLGHKEREKRSETLLCTKTWEIWLIEKLESGI